MGSYYFDTSAIVKLYIPEAGSIWVESLVSQQDRHDFVHIIAFVKLGLVETAAALTRRQQMRHITRQKRDQLYASFMRDAQRRYLMLAVSDELLLLAASLTQRHLLRGYDAVHLAGAISLNQYLGGARLPPLTFVSADNDLLAAAAIEGLATDNPNQHL